MTFPNARHLSLLVDVVCYGLIVLSIYHFIGIDLETAQSLIELPPAELYALAQSRFRQKPLPESWSGPYKHLSSSKWIRLCKITRTEHDGYFIVLDKYLLAQAPPYRALSYTWGPAEGGYVPYDGTQLEVLVHGRNRSVPINLISAISNLPNGSLDGYYWIDAVCIDQLNHKERNEQVAIMDKIFQRAVAVDVWLGKAYSDTQKINDIARDLVSLQEQEQEWPTPPAWATGEDLLLPSDWETLAQIFSRRWFHRLWTLQEFALAGKVNVLCGNVTIDTGNLSTAARFLFDHDIPMTLSYGNEKRTITPPILPMSLLQQSIQGHRMLELDFLRCFTDNDISSQIDYETLLVWVYWQSMTKIATDARDYVFGIAGVANALANRIGLQYEPLKIDYSLTAAEAFQAFVVRIMGGRLGIRAISIVRQSADIATQQRNNVRIGGLPSWVPDLANRNRVGLSMNGGLRSIEEGQVCHNILGQHSAASEYRSRSVNGSALHVHAHRIGKIQKCSQVLPNDLKIQECANFVLSLIPLLNKLPITQHATNHTPVEALFHTLRLGINPSASKHARESYGQADLERYFVQALYGFIWSKSLPPHHQSAEQTMSWLTHGPGHNPWEIAGLTKDFPLPSALASRAESHQLNWLLQKGNISEDIKQEMIDLSASCTAFRRAFGARVAATKLFLIQLHDDNRIHSSWPAQKLPGPIRLLGIGSDNVEGGDELWAAAGAEWPFILKRHQGQKSDQTKDGEREALKTYQLKGEAFVYGVMHGELFENSAPEWKQIVLQ